MLRGVLIRDSLYTGVCAVYVFGRGRIPKPSLLVCYVYQPLFSLFESHWCGWRGRSFGSFVFEKSTSVYSGWEKRDTQDHHAAHNRGE